MNIKEYYRKSFWKTLPTKSYIKLLIAIFFTFSSVGFIVDLWSGAQQALPQLLINVLYSGIVSIGYGHAAMRNWKFFPVVIVFQILYAFLSGQSDAGIPLDDAIKTRLMVDGLGILAVIMIGYVFFLIFISGEGIPQVQLKTEMNLAREMHEVLVPPIQFENEHFSIYGDSVPASEVGGDLLDIHQTETGLTCYVVDVSGHGVAASLLMGMFKSAVHTLLQKEQSLSAMFNGINQSLHRLKKPSMFLTAAAIQFHPSKNSAEFSIAGHLPILHYQASAQSIRHLMIKQIPLSVKLDYAFKTETISYEKGDVFLFLTDGLTEAINSDKEEFGLQQIEALLIQNQSLSPKQMFEVVLKEVQQHGEQRDDQTMLVVRCLK